MLTSEFFHSIVVLIFADDGFGANELHHIVPRAIGGSDTEANIVPLCADDHRRVTDHDREACAALRRSLTDAEYAYAVEKLGEARFEARYPVEYRRPGARR